MPKPWGPVPPWTHLLLSTGSLKEPKHQHNSNLSPSRTRDIYAPQEQWLYTWNGYSWKTCKVQRKSWEGNAVCLSSHSHAVLCETAWPTQDGSVDPGDQNTDPQNFCWCLICPPPTDTQHSPVKSCCWEIMRQVLSSCQPLKFPALQHWLQCLLQNYSILGPMSNSAFLSYLPVAVSCGSWLSSSVISLESPLDPDWPEGSYTTNQPKPKPWIK